MINAVAHNLSLAAPNLPSEAWWVALLALLILAAAAAVDMVKGIVPDPLIFLGTVGLVAALGLYVEWPFAAHQLTYGLIAAAAVWAVNEGWHRLFKHDALGLGDAKWSMLAVTCFGALPVLFAWGLGAALGSAWIVAQRLVKRPTAHVHFAPFLFVGLLAGLWTLRLGGMKILFAAFHAP